MQLPTQYRASVTFSTFNFGPANGSGDLAIVNTNGDTTFATGVRVYGNRPGLTFNLFGNILPILFIGFNGGVGGWNYTVQIYV